MASIFAGDWDALDGNEAAEWASHLANMTYSFYSSGTLFYADGDYTIAISGLFAPQGGDETPASYSPDTKVDSVSIRNLSLGLGLSMSGLDTTLADVLSSVSPYDLVPSGAPVDVYGSRLDDTVNGITLGETYSGRDGIDTVVLDGTSYDYSVSTTFLAGLGWVANVYAAGTTFPSSKIFLDNVEIIQFANGTMYVDGSKPNDLDEKPTSLAISNSMLLENQGSNVEVGIFSAVDPEGKPLTYSLTNDSSGAFSLEGTKLIANQSFDAEQRGIYTVTLMVKDAFGFEVSQAFEIWIGNVNEAPTVSAGIADAVAEQGSAFHFQIPADAFSDVDSNISYSATLGNGADLPSWLSFDQETGVFSGTPGNDDVGKITVKVTASDGSLSVDDEFDISVANINDAPTGSSTAVFAHGSEDSDYVLTTESLLKGFSDIDGDSLSISGLIADDGTGTKIVEGGDGNYIVTAPLNYAGDVNLTYTVSDGHGGSTVGHIVLQLDEVNDAPVASGDSATMSEHDTISVDVLSNDSDVDFDNIVLKSASVSSPNGTVSINANGTLRISYTGEDISSGENEEIKVSYTISDGELTSEATLTIDVAGQDYDPGDDIVGTSKADKLKGSKLGELIKGLAGDDTINGNDGNDIIDGGKGEDKMVGNGGADTFIFAKGYGKDMITDFLAVGKHHDVIDLSKLAAVDDFKDLKSHHLSMHGHDVWIDGGKSDLLIIKGVELHELSKGDFHF